jgi:hypothetical protein
MTIESQSRGQEGIFFLSIAGYEKITANGLRIGG